MHLCIWVCVSTCPCMCAYACGCVCVCIGGVPVFVCMSVCVYVSVFLSVLVCVCVFVSVPECVSVCQRISVSICVCVCFWGNMFHQFIPLLSSPVVAETRVNKHLLTMGLETHRFGCLTTIFQPLPFLDGLSDAGRMYHRHFPPCQARNRFRAKEAEV